VTVAKCDCRLFLLLRHHGMTLQLRPLGNVPGQITRGDGLVADCHLHPLHAYVVLCPHADGAAIPIDPAAQVALQDFRPVEVIPDSDVVGGLCPADCWRGRPADLPCTEPQVRGMAGRCGGATPQMFMESLVDFLHQVCTVQCLVTSIRRFVWLVPNLLLRPT